MDWGMTLELFNGIMGRYLKGIGKMEWKMDMASGNLHKDTIMRVIGLIIDNRAREFLSIDLVHIEVFLSTSWKKARAKNYLQMEIHIKDNTRGVSQMVKERINGPKEAYTKATLLMEWEMVMVNW